jgi:squalene-hopene/tetraprenyl-beta-curcumene cyclase
MTRSSALVAVLCAALAVTSAADEKGKGAAEGLSADTREQLTVARKRGADYLRQQQQPDGMWEKHAGITALVVVALLNESGIPREQKMKTVEPALDALVRLAKPDGGIYDGPIPHYITAVSTTALAAGGRPSDRPVIEKARKYLADNLLDEGEGVDKEDKWYGGMGYGSAQRPDRRADLISLEYALRAMKDADLPANDPAWQKAIQFLQRTQNHSESNDQEWAANDGGFVYYPGFSYHAEGGTRSYGSVSYAGLLSYTYANVKRSDARVQAVLKWIRENYTVDENPGMGQKTVYYYYMVFAKALAAVDEPTIVDARGRRHNWREELGRKLLALQHAEGYWVNEVKDEMQDNKVLVTTFTLSAIDAILK